MTVSRRGFLGLVGGFAAVSALPGHGGILKPAALAVDDVDYTDLCGLPYWASEEFSAPIKTATGLQLLYGLPYWQSDAHSGIYAGIERSAHPVFLPEKRFRK